MPRPPATHCTTCGVELTDATAFRRARSRTFRSPCRKCASAYRKAWRAEVTAAHRVTPTDTCSVCGSAEVLTPKGRVRLDAQDRDPVSGEVHGLLCPECRKAVAAAGPDPERLRKAAAYLEGHDR